MPLLNRHARARITARQLRDGMSGSCERTDTALRGRSLKPATIGLGPEELTLRRGDVKLVEIGSAEATLVRHVGGQRVRLDHRPAGREHRDDGSRTAPAPAAARHDVAIGVETQTLDPAVRAAMVLAERVQNRMVVEAAVAT